MSKKSFIPAISTALILILTVSGALVIESARANPVPWPSTPNQEKPTLTVQSPQNNAIYKDSDEIFLNFTVTKPESWNAVHMVVHYVGAIESVNVYLDGNLTNYGRTYAADSDFSVKLNQTAPGQHFLNVTVLSYTFYYGQIYDNSSIISGITDVDTINGVSVNNTIYEYPIVVSDIIHFTVSPPTQNISPLTSAPKVPTWIILPIVVVFLSVVIFGLLKGRKQSAVLENSNSKV